MEHRLDDDHRLSGATYPVCQIVDGDIRIVEAPALTAINMRLRDDYSRDAAGGVGRWNKIIESTGIKFELKLPHEGFNRKIGVFANQRISPEGKFLDATTWEAAVRQWLPSLADGDYIQSLMKPCSEPGKFAGWIAAPKVGIDNKGGDFEYVKLHMA
jgi:benzoyl-CoA 2,3-dioxygenase component B